MKIYLLRCQCSTEIPVGVGQAGTRMECPSCGLGIDVPTFRELERFVEKRPQSSASGKGWTVLHAVALAGTAVAIITWIAVALIGSPANAVIDAATIRTAVAAVSDQQIVEAWESFSHSGVVRPPTDEEHKLLQSSQFTGRILRTLEIVGACGAIVAIGGGLWLGCRRGTTVGKTAGFPGKSWVVLCVFSSLLTLSAAAQPLSPGGVRTGIFGLEAQGNKFVYVFDRSASMGDPDGKPLAAAKRELLRSLSELGDVQQFYLIFYNQKLQIFNPAEARGRLIFATENNRKAARKFVESVRADGATQHADAIATALRMGPDVIFLLTDGDAGDDLSQEDLESLTQSIGRTKCLVVQFGGNGEQRSPRLARLASQSGGQYRVLDGDQIFTDGTAARAE